MRLFETAVSKFLLGDRLDEMSEFSIILKKDEGDTKAIVSDLRSHVNQLKKDFHKQYMSEKANFKKMKPDEEAEFRKGGGKEPLEKWAEIEVDVEHDTVVVNVKIEDAASAKKVFDEKMLKRIREVGSVEDFSD